MLKLQRPIATCLAMLTTLLSLAQNPAFHPMQLKLGWRLIKNFTAAQPHFTCLLTFTNTGKEPMPASGWELFFNLRYHGYTLSSGSPFLQVKHVNGELFVISPSSGNLPLFPGKTLSMEYSGNGRIENFQDLPTGFFWVNDADSNRAIEMGKVSILSTGGLSSTAADLPLLIPTPGESIRRPSSFTINGHTTITADTLFRQEARYLSNELKGLLNYRPAIADHGGSIRLIYNNSLPKEGYKLNITKENILIEAGDNSGVFYGIQSLKCLLPVNAWKESHAILEVPSVEVNDAPRFGYRGLMLDVARNFRSKKEIMRILDLMALYKLNVFHLHFCDDEGWRLEIPGLPELTDVGGHRGYPFADNHQLQPSYGSGENGVKTAGSGFYSRRDFIEILQYAASRHISVIPEIESPGHARAAVKAMQNRYEKFRSEGKLPEALEYNLTDTADKSVYLSNQGFNDNVMNVALPSTYRFMEKVIDEIVHMYSDAGVSLLKIHLAGDETPDGSWERSPAATQLIGEDPSLHGVKSLWHYYFDSLKVILAKRGLGLYGWQELVTGVQNNANPIRTVDPQYARDDTWIDAWWNLEGSEDMPYKLANAGYKTVLCCVDYFYFDLAYEKGFDEPGDGWIGFLDLEKILSFLPYNYTAFAIKDIRGAPYTSGDLRKKDSLEIKMRSNIIGIKGALWGENLLTDNLTEYQLIPKMLALSEKCWSTPQWEAETDPGARYEAFEKMYAAFLKKLDRTELPRLDYYDGGYHYRNRRHSAKITGY